MLYDGLTPTTLIYALAALCCGGLLLSFVYPVGAKRRAYDSRFTAIATSGPALAGPNRNSDNARRKRSVEETLREIEEKQKSQAKRNKSKPQLIVRLRQAELNWSKRTYYVVCAAVALLTFIVVVAVGGEPLAAGGFAFAGGLFLPHLFVNFRRNRRFKRFTAEFTSAVDVIVRGIKSGLPLSDCMKIIATEAQDPVRSEFKTVVEDQTLGVPMDEAVQRLAERVPLSEANFFAIVIGIQARSGGSLAEALGNLSKVLRERKKMQAKIKAMSSEAKASGGIIGSLPIIVAGLVYFTTPDYISLLFTETLGNIVLAGSAVWMMFGILVMRKMINFDF